MDFFLSSISTVFLWITHPFKSSSTTSNQDFTFLLHSTPFIYYRGTHTYVSFSLLNNGNNGQTRIDSKDIKVELIQRGWRAGLFGWNLASYLGANTKKGLEITPENFKNWSQAGDGRDSSDDNKDSIGMDSLTKKDSISSTSTSSSIQAPTLSLNQTKRYDSQIQKITDGKAYSTFLVRVPVSSGDGYFRLTLKDSSSGKPIINSPTLRIFSFSLSSASPRGSSILPPTLVPELLLRTISTIIYTALLGLFPVVALFEKILPKAWSRWILKKLYNSVGGEEKKKRMLEKMKVQDKINGAREGVYKTVPFASAGVRTDYDLDLDAKAGRGGVCFLR